MEIELPDGPLAKLAFAWALLAICVTIHAAGLLAIEGWGRLAKVNPEGRFWKNLWTLIRVAWAIILLHLVEMLIWAMFYVWKDCMPDLSTSFYFSSVTYTTVGYGDLVLPLAWRNLAGVEALTGILMSGLSTGFFFMVLNRMFRLRVGHH